MPPLSCAPLTRRRFLTSAAALAAAGFARPAAAGPDDVLDKLLPIHGDSDLAKLMVDGLHRYLDHELGLAAGRRAKGVQLRLVRGPGPHYETFLGTPPTIVEERAPLKVDATSVEAYVKSIEPARQRLRQIIGVIDERVKPATMEFPTTGEPAALAAGGKPIAIAKSDSYSVFAVRWPVFDGVEGEGLLLQPNDKPVARVVAIPDADQTPEQLVGLAPGIFPGGQLARRLVENGCQVIVPTLIDRKDTWSGNARLGRMTNQPHREFIYRMAFELGRHIIGYEVQKVLAAVDWFTQENSKTKMPIGVIGYAEGGLIAFYSAAVDQRIDAAAVSCYFTQREKVIEPEPIYRNVWGLVRDFGDAGVAELVAPRGLVIENAPGPSVEGPPAPRQGRGGAAPGKIIAPRGQPVAFEFGPVSQRYFFLKRQDKFGFTSGDASVHPGQDATLRAFLRLLDSKADLKPLSQPPTDARKDFDANVRQKRQFDQLVELTQQHLRLAEERRQPFCWAKLKLNSLDEYKKSIEPLRKYFWEEVIGKLPELPEKQSVLSRKLHDEPKWSAWEIGLNTYPEPVPPRGIRSGNVPDGVFAYGILCVPKDLKDGERRPVVVCQHGLEGRPRDVVNPKEKTKYYNSFGSALADKGYVVFAPQNPYIFQNHFRQVQRKANPLGLSLFAFIVRQHERILNWLETLPFVDPKRMAFYGLSYGGKTAMRVPAILEKYCLSICSADFNEWTWKNASVDFKGSYMFTPEYEMYEFDLGNTFGYAEMAALIAPRPFMVERGHDDGVGIDEWVAYEYAKIRRLYAKLGIPERTAIEFFNGGHEINSKGTFAFLQRHLGWPA